MTKGLHLYNAKGSALLLSAESAKRQGCFSHELLLIYLKSLAQITNEAAMDETLTDHEAGTVHSFMEYYAEKIGGIYEGKSI